MFCLAISRMVTSPEEAMGRQGESLRVRTTLQRFSTVVVLNLWGHLRPPENGDVYSTIYNSNKNTL